MRHTACIVLAGGAGTRIRHLYPDRPKPLVPVAGRPFLDWICAYWARQGVDRLIVSLGHLAETAERHLAGNPCAGMEVHVVREQQPLGTGGAIRLAAQSGACTDPFVAVNGDSLLFGDLSGAWAELARPEVDGVLLGVQVEDASRFGSLRTGAGGALLGFEEKHPGRGWVNAGIYFFKKRLLPLFPEQIPLSMERDVFPALIAAGARLQAHFVHGDFLDIGTPEGLRQADAFIQRHRAELSSTGWSA